MDADEALSRNPDRRMPSLLWILIRVYLRLSAAKFQPSDLRAFAIAALTRTGAVPPRWLRLFSDPSSVSVLYTSSVIADEKRCSSESFNSANSEARDSAERTACATASCASRNGTPLRARYSARSGEVAC